MSINLSEIDPFGETPMELPMELPMEQESYEGTTRHTRRPVISIVIGDDDVTVKECYQETIRLYCFVCW